jgi:uncharacterized membrane protein
MVRWPFLPIKNCSNTGNAKNRSRGEIGAKGEERFIECRFTGKYDEDHAMIPNLQIFLEWLSKLPILDLIALIVFLAGATLYKIFLALQVKTTEKKYYIHQLQFFRNAWIEKYGMGGNPLLVVQTLRNKTMVSSFMASTALIMIIGGFNVVFGVDFEKIRTGKLFFFSLQDPNLGIVKVLLIIVVLLYSFFHFLWHTRELHNMALVLNVPAEQLQRITSLQPLDFLTKMYINSGVHFTLGIRGFYFLIPLLLWMFHPAMMLFSFFSIVVFLIRRDLGLAQFQK